MKNTRSYLILLCIAITLISCTQVVFLHSASINKSNRVFRSELFGSWMNITEDSGIVVSIDTVRRYDSSIAYKISLIGETDSDFGDSSYMDGELLNLEGKLFLMVSNDFDNSKLQEIGLYNASLIPQVYNFIRIFSISKDSIQIGRIDGDSLTNLLDKKKISLKHDITGDGIVILDKGKTLVRKLIEMEKFREIYTRLTYYRLK